MTATDLETPASPRQPAAPAAPAPAAPAPAAPACGGPDAIAARLIAARTAAEGLSDDEPCLSIAEVAELTGVTAHTLRYYERIGLVEVPRDDAGRRVYSPLEVGRIVFVTRLRLTAMPIREIQAYFALVAQGDGTEAQRLDLLQRHRRDVVARMDELRSAVSVIDFKIALYGGAPG